MEHIEVDDQGMCQGELNTKTNTHRSGPAYYDKISQRFYGLSAIKGPFTDFQLQIFYLS